MKCISIAVAFALVVNVHARPEWDQAEAVKRVKAVVALEEAQGQPWDKIRWETDRKRAVAEAKRSGRPIFVYWYVDRGGPAAAPC